MYALFNRLFLIARTTGTTPPADRLDVVKFEDRLSTLYTPSMPETTSAVQQYQP